MKLAEALILRADCQKKVAQLRERLKRSALVQEGETPVEDAQTLLNELTATIRHLETLIQQINRTNSQTSLENGSLADALATRDILSLRWSALNTLIQDSSVSRFRYSATEVRWISTIDIAAIQTECDRIARDRRELDARIQALNWQVDLID